MQTTDYNFTKAVLNTTINNKPAQITVTGRFEEYDYSTVESTRNSKPCRTISLFSDVQLSDDTIELLADMVDDVFGSLEPVVNAADSNRLCTRVDIEFPTVKPSGYEWDETDFDDCIREFIFHLNPFFSGTMTIYNF